MLVVGFNLRKSHRNFAITKNIIGLTYTLGNNNKNSKKTEIDPLDTDEESDEENDEKNSTASYSKDPRNILLTSGM